MDGEDDAGALHLRHGSPLGAAESTRAASAENGHGKS